MRWKIFEEFSWVLERRDLVSEFSFFLKHIKRIAGQNYEEILEVIHKVTWKNPRKYNQNDSSQKLNGDFNRNLPLDFARKYCKIYSKGFLRISSKDHSDSSSKVSKEEFSGIFISYYFQEIHREYVQEF